MNRCYIALGSNLDNPLQQVEEGARAIAGLGTVLACSSWYRSKPVGPQDQPDFINGVLQLETALTPIALLDALQAIEQNHHRIRERHWGPRTLDLDILLYNDQQIDEARLTVPHREMKARGFVIFPLLEIAGNLQLPDGENIREIAARLDASSLEKLT